MEHKKLILLIVVFLFAGCAKKVIEDTSPKFETAVIKATVQNSGIKGMFAYNGEEISNTREDRKQTRYKMKFSGAVMSIISSGSDQSTIQRVDKNLLWEINNKGKRYTECPLGGCQPVPGQFSFSSMKKPPKEGDEPPMGSAGMTQNDLEKDEGCATIIVENTFDVKQTGQTKTINKYPTKEYRMLWRLVVEDDKKRQSINVVQANLWTTDITKDIQRVLNMEKTFQRNYMAKLKLDRPDLTSVLPQEAMTLLTTYFFNTIPPEQREKILNISKKVKKIKGYPILTKLEWNASSDACQVERSATIQQEQNHDIDLSRGVAGMMGSLSGMLVKSQVVKEQQKSQAKPLFGYVREVKSIGMDMVHDSIMNVPRGFEMEKRK